MVAIALRLTIIALLIYAGVTFWYRRVEERLQEPQPEVSKVQEEVSQAQEEPEASEENYQIILTRNIFQAGPGVGSGQPQVDVEDLAETRLQLSLLGTVTGEQNDARAIIRDEKTKVEELYPTGVSVQGAVISRITRGKVVLLVNGREEVLTIKDPESGSQEPDLSSRAGTRTMERGGESPEREIMTKVPEAQPRRRISFRNTPPPPQKMEQLGRSQTLEPEPTGEVDKPPQPNEGAVPPEPEMERNGEQQR